MRQVETPFDFLAELQPPPARRTKSRKPNVLLASETQVQISIISRGRMLGVKAIHIPNAAKRSRNGHMFMRKQGMMLGCPDLYCVSKVRLGAHCFLEVKEEGWRPPGGEGETFQHWSRQQDAHNALRDFGVFVAVVTSQEQAEAAWREAGLL